MSYKRITKEDLCYSEWVQKGNSPSELYYFLKELEDKIEKGTLIELHCKVGDTVYQFDNGGRIYEATILNIEIHKGKPYYETCGVDFDNTAINESIFLNKAEAEKKLESLKNATKI